jgi:transposase
LPTAISVPSLPEQALGELTRRFNVATKPESRLRYQMVLLSQQGHSVSQIAKITLRSHDTVTRVLKRYLAGGLDAVPRRTAPGRSRVVTPAWETELLRVIELDPHEVGVQSAVWTTGLLAKYLAGKTGISVDQETVRKYLTVNEYVCKRPTWTLKRKAQERPDYVGNA